MKEIAVNYSYHCRIFWNKFQRQKYKWQEHGCSTHMPGILNEQGLELDFQRCYQWLRTRTSFSIWSRSSPWERPSTSWLPHRTGQASTKPGTHERAENLPQSEKLSNFRCVHAFKNIKHQKRQNCGDSSEKWDWLDEVSCDKSRILWLPIFFFSAPFLDISLCIFLRHYIHKPATFLWLTKIWQFLRCQDCILFSETSKDLKCVGS